MRRPLAELEAGADLPPAVWRACCDDLADGIAEMIRGGHWPVTETPRRPRREPRLVVEMRGETDVQESDGS